MFKSCLILFFLAVAVAGQQDLPNNVQQTPNGLMKKLCGRRKLVGQNSQTVSDAWVPTYHSSIVLPSEQQAQQLTPQSLKETLGSEGENRVEYESPATESLKNVNHNIKNNLVEKLDDTGSLSTRRLLGKGPYFQSTSNLKLASDYNEENSDLCTFVNNRVNKESEKEAVKIIAKCIQNDKTSTRRNMNDNKESLIPPDDIDDGDFTSLLKNNDLNASEFPTNIVLKQIETPKQSKQEPSDLAAVETLYRRKMIDNDIESQFLQPAAGEGIADSKKSLKTSGGSSRICYACSTVTDPSCWKHDHFLL